VDEAADSLSAGEIDLPGSATKIVAPSGKDVPFARKGADVHLFASETGTYRITGSGGETTVAINAPPLPSERVQLTAAETAEIEGEPMPPATWDAWRWLVVLAAVALWAEWWLYYAAKERQRAAEASEASGDSSLPDIDAGPEQEPGERVESGFRNSNLVGR
jgi:hypothetical protein